MKKKDKEKKPLKSEVTQKRILDAGLTLWPNISARGVAAAMKPKMAHPTVMYHFPDNLEDAIARHAVETGCSRVIAQLIATNHKAIRKLSPAERTKHLKALA